MSDSIKLSPKHGLNTCIPICFWCGKEKNEIAMLGKIDKADSKAPMKAILNYEPCEACKEAIGKGIHVIGVQEKPIVEQMHPIAETPEGKLYPTGSFFVSTPEWTKAMLEANGNGNLVEEVLNKKTLLMPEEIVEQIIEDFGKEAKEVKVNTDFMEEDTNENN